MKTPEIESTVIVKPNDADAAGRLLLAIAESTVSDMVQAVNLMEPEKIREVANALLAIGNDTDAIVAPSEYIAPIYSGPRFEVRTLYDDSGKQEIVTYRVWDNAESRYCDGIFDSRDTAETWAYVLSEAEGVPEAPEPVPLKVDAEAAKLVAGVLQFLATTSPYSEGWVVLMRNQLRQIGRWQIEDVASCLKSLSNNANAMIIQREDDGI